MKLVEPFGRNGGDLVATSLNQGNHLVKDLPRRGVLAGGRIISTPPSGSPLAIPCHCSLNGSKLTRKTARLSRWTPGRRSARGGLPNCIAALYHNLPL